MRYGLIGEKLGHSYSPQIHALLGLEGYELFEVPRGELARFLREGPDGGLNVTIPYKREVLPMCDTLSSAAERIGSVNTLLIQNGKIYGHNTDYDGFLYMAERAGVALKGRRVAILGSGGAAAAVRTAVHDAGAAETVLVSRSGPYHYGNLEKIRHFDVVVNATPVGMYPNTEQAPLDLRAFEQLSGVLDLIYNPLRTPLLRQAAALGLPSGGGLSMLAEQGRAASALFQGREIAKEESARVCATLLREVENIVLVGMPGCGKSSVGRGVASALGRPFVDTDEQIRETTGKSAEEIILEEGEGRFREIESAVIGEQSRRRGIVLATGGGAVLREENRAALRQNGRVYWVTASLARLSTEGRPLSRDLEALYQTRKPLYEAAADATVSNSGTSRACIAQILEEFDAHLSH